MKTSIPYDNIVGACWDADLDEDRAIRTGYSGRGMYGKECLAVVYDQPVDLIRFVVAMAERGWGDALTDSVAQDSMGLGAVIYWPNVTVVDGNDE